MQLCLTDLNVKGIEQSNFSKLEYESPYIRQYSLEQEVIFTYREYLKTRRIPKKKGIVFAVLIDCIHKENPEFSFEDSTEFKTEQEATNFFENKKFELGWFYKKDKEENKIFDGRRYMLKLDENNKIIEKGWD